MDHANTPTVGARYRLERPGCLISPEVVNVEAVTEAHVFVSGETGAGYSVAISEWRSLDAERLIPPSLPLPISEQCITVFASGHLGSAGDATVAAAWRTVDGYYKGDGGVILLREDGTWSQVDRNGNPLPRAVACEHGNVVAYIGDDHPVPADGTVEPLPIAPGCAECDLAAVDLPSLVPATA